MIEPPSTQLIETLNRLGLCSPGDLRRCRPYVRRLARDLPAFDSVWIDALVNNRKLTLFQARQLESGHAERIKVGPCLLCERLGQGAIAETFLARHRHRRERCVLKLIDCPIEFQRSRLKALELLVANFKGVSHPSFVAPSACLEHDGRLVTVSRYIPGPHLGELLIRRGRFAAANVTEIARQLVDALATLEQHGGAHGEINLRNVRLTTSGVAVLVDTGISMAVLPELTIHARRPPQRYDGIAPELIGTGSHPDAMSDLYALGCMLWHLLAGRPPYPTGDPLGKLAAHQTRTITDVRQWAPDTPADLAEAIAGFTARNPAERPASIREVRERLGRPGRGGRRQLKRFRADFNTAAPRSPVASSSAKLKHWPVFLLLLFAISGISLGLLDQGARSDPLSLPSRVAGFLQRVTSDWFPSNRLPNDTETLDTRHRETVPTTFRQIPEANDHGVILLDSNGPFLWRQIDAVGSLTIRGKAGLYPQVVVTQPPTQVAAQQLTLENIHFRYNADPREVHGPSSPLLLVRSQQLTLRGCSFQTDDLAEKDSPFETGRSPKMQPIAIAWKVSDRGDQNGGRVTIRDTVFAGRSTALFLSGVPASLECRNCLKVGGGAMFTVVGNMQPGRLLKVQLSQVTLRQAESLVRWESADNQSPAGYIVVQADDCVFDLAGRTAALFQFVAASPIDATTTRIELTGAGSLARTGLVESIRTTNTGAATALANPAVVELEGITTGPFTFAGPLDLFPGHSSVESFQVPRRSPRPPGIAPARLSLPAAESP